MRYLYTSCEDEMLSYDRILTLEERYCETCDVYYKFLGKYSEEVIKAAPDIRLELIKYIEENNIKLTGLGEFLYELVKLLDHEEELLEKRKSGLINY